MKKKVLGISLAAILLIGSSISTFASGFITYTNYQLYANWANNYTNTHAKTTNDQFIQNKVTNLYNTTSAVFWACNSNCNKISNTYTFNNSGGFNQLQTIKLNSKKSKGDIVCMGMEDGWTKSGRGIVSGKVDFR